MIFRNELEEKGFTFIENPGLDKMLYDFSDFELFECNVREHTKITLALIILFILMILTNFMNY